MADRASASITIGGPISRSCIPGLIAAIEMDGGRADWEGEPVDEVSIRDGETLEAFACELCGGIFQEVESFCEEHALPFVRSSASCAGAFGPERVIFTGEKPTTQFDLTEHDEVAAKPASQPDLFAQTPDGDTPAAPVPTPEMPVPEPVPAAPAAGDAVRQDFTLAPRRGRQRIEIDVYDRENGPAKKAQPA